MPSGLMSWRFDMRGSWGRNRLVLLERKFCEELNAPLKFVLSLHEGPDFKNGGL
jgi:hypothetical protein